MNATTRGNIHLALRALSFLLRLARYRHRPPKAETHGR